MISKHTGTFRKDILWLQWIGGTGSMLLLFMCGMMGGWTSPYMAKLTAKDSPLPITLDEASWVASLLNMGRLLGAVPGAVSVYYFGSKRTLLFNGFPLIVGWVCLILADSVIWLYIARLVIGLSMGMLFSSFPLYLGEISSPSIRGALITLAMNGLPLGTVTGNFIGAYVSMSIFAYICLVPTFFCIILFIWIPESPHHLIRVDKTEEAKKSLANYNPGIDVEFELKSLQEFINASQSSTFLEKLREFNIPENRKAGIIVVVLYLFMQLSGCNNILFYMEIIFTKGGLTAIQPSLMVIVAGVSGIFSGFVTVYLADKFGRRPLLIASSVGVAVSMVALGLHFALLERNFDPAGLQWVLISSILVYEMFVFIGLCPVPSMVLSELFAPNIKSIAACFSSISVGLFSFLATKTYQPMIDAMGEPYVFWLIAVFMVFTIIFTLTIMPETKGKSLQEIQDILHKK